MAAITHMQLWAALTAEEHRDACLAFWTSEDVITNRVRPMLSKKLAEVMRFREKFLKVQPRERLAGWLFQRIGTDEMLPFTDDVLRAWLLVHHAPVIEHFLDACGLPRTGCFVADEAPSPDEASFSRGISAIRAKFGDRLPSLYLGFMMAEGATKFWKDLPQAVARSKFDLSAALGPFQEAGATVVPAPEPEAMSEDSAAMTTLDNLLIRTLVAGVLASDGALSADQVESLVEEVIDLSSERHRSYFHRGYFHALFERTFNFDFPGVNEQRRAWYAEGYFMGLIRRADKTSCVRLLKEKKDLRSLLLTGTATPCGAQLLRYMYEPLRDAEEFGILKEWLQHQLPRMTRDHREAMAEMMQDDGAALLRRGRAAEAQLLLEFVDEILKRDTAFDTETKKLLEPRNMRKRAQVMQAQGNFDAAREILEKLLVGSDVPDAGNAQTDFGLIKGGFRSLTSILPPREKGSVPARRDALERGREEFDVAARRPGEESTNACFCLGMLWMLNERTDAASAVDLFQRCLSEMLKREELYIEGGLIHWARFGLALALLETGEMSNLQQAGERIAQVMESALVVPDWLWVEVLQQAALFEDRELNQKLIDHVLKHGGESIFRAIGDASLYELPGIRRPYSDWLANQTLSATDRWKRLESMLGKDDSADGVELDRDILDLMEGLAVEHPTCRAGLKELLTRTDRHEAAWNRSETELVLTKLYELDGAFSEAAVCLSTRFFRLRESGKPHELFEARQIAERIHAYQLPDDPSVALLNCLQELGEEDQFPATVEQRLRGGEKVRVLYIGGNETQENYSDRIKADLKVKYSGVELDLFLPGWSSSWNLQLDKVKPMIGRSDVVVLSTLVRTQFGRHVREFCGSQHPWLPCTGRGRKSLQGSIERAAAWVLEPKSAAKA